MSILQKIIEIILTHPKDTIGVNDVMSELPDGTNRHTVAVSISRDLKNAGYIEKIGQDGKMAIYKILSRDPNLNIPSSKKPKKQQEISSVVTGKAIVRYILRLEEKVREVSSAYSDLQSELSKEKSAYLVNRKENLKTINVLKEEIQNLRATIKRQEDTGPGFTMREMIQ